MSYRDSVNRGRPIVTVPGRALVALVVAAIAYAGLGCNALISMYRFYGGSGHPPAPSAPSEVYVGVFLVALPALSLAIGLLSLWLGRKLLSRLARRRSEPA